MMVTSDEKTLNVAIKNFIQEAKSDLQHNDLVSAYNKSALLYRGTRVENFELPEALYKFFLDHGIDPIKHFADGKEIPIKAFSGFRSTKKFTLPDSIEYVRYCAFHHCALEIPNLPKSLKEVEGAAFSWCKNLTIAEWPQNLEEIGAMAFTNVHILNGNLPDKLRVIGDRSLHQCKGFTEIVIPKSVTTIGEGILDYSSVEKIIFLGKPTQIHSEAIRWCDAKEIHVPWARKEVDIIFPKEAKIYYHS